MFTRFIGKFWQDSKGYVIALVLIAMPMLLGFSLLVIDISRGNNLHTDLQNAVDAMALAGARELDGRDDAITRATAAIATLANSASFGGGGAGMQMGAANDAITSGDVQVHYLSAIPPLDSTAITAAYLTANAAGPNEATYAYVRATPLAMQTIFPLPVGLTRQDVSISAQAVAVYRASACDVTPVYICNPFENPAGGDPVAAAEELHDKFAAGELYGRQIQLSNTGAAKVGPGNFGFLRTTGNGAQVLAEALAVGQPGVCFKQDNLETQTGAIAGPVEAGLNTRFGIYGASFKKYDNDYRFRPARNTRMGKEMKGAKNCSTYKAAASPYDAIPLGHGTTMETIPGGGGQISTANNWNLDLYWHVAHSGAKVIPPNNAPSPYVPPPAPAAAIKAFSSTYPGGATPAGMQPSAYDVYRYELGSANSTALLADKSPNTETGNPQCHSVPNFNTYDEATYGDRREIFAAIVNCIDQDPTGQSNIEAVAFARMFLVKPAVADADNRYMTMETMDITGRGGRGTVDEFLREEAELVR